MRALALALGLIATPAIAAEQFDLVCTATGGDVRYRIDLGAGEYCVGKCERVTKIADVTSGLLVLERTEKSHARGKESRIEINRNTGDWHTSSFNPAFDTVPFVRDGKCELAPYSGMPRAKF